MQYFSAITKATDDLGFFLQSIPFNITVIQVYAPTSNAEEADIEEFCEDPEDFLEQPQPQKRYHFHHRGLECESKEI